MTWDASRLRKLTREIASVPPPQIDWDAAEERLLQAVDREESRPSQLLPLPERAGSGRRVLSLAAGAAALAAGVALYAGNASRPHDPAAAVATPANAVTQDARPHGPDANLLVADALPSKLSFDSRASIVLAPHSKLRVDAAQVPIRLSLLQGQVHVRVHPDHGADVLSVRVDRTVVSVHGTEFTVTRAQHKVLVDVQHGTVGIGEVARHGVAQRWLLQGPSRGSFSLDGATQAHFLSPAASDKHAAPPIATSARVPIVNTPSHQRVVPSSNNSSGTQRAQVIQGLRSKIYACYESFAPKPSQSGVTVKVTTNVDIRMAPDGHVKFARFDPPLNPKAQECASEAVRVAKFPPTAGGDHVQLRLSF